MNAYDTYWKCDGNYQDAYEQLVAIAYTTGSLNKEVNPALAKFWAAAECYDDLYKTNLRTHFFEFKNVFGFCASEFKHPVTRKYTPYLYELVEAEMDKIVIAAAKEQGLIK